MKILVINCGSSSLKYQLIDMENEVVLAKGNYERIGQENSFLTHKVGDNKYERRKSACQCMTPLICWISKRNKNERNGLSG